MNADGLIFYSVFPVWIVLGAASLLGAFFIWKEIQRRHRYLAWRIIAQLVVLLSLIGLILRPSMKTEKAIGAALLLTRGYDKNAADSLVRAIGLRTIRVFDAASYSNSETLSSWHLLQKDAKDIRFVLGEGIPASALDEFDLHFDYIKGTMPYGITQLSIEPLKKNQINFIQGQVNYNDGPATLKLVGPAGVEDSLQLKGQGTVPFSLSILARQEGKFIYQLNLIAGGKMIGSENLPVEILPEKKLTILFLQQYPSFETRYLKNYLGEKGHAVTMRYQVSKTVFRYEYANRDKQVFPKLSSQLLSGTDLLMTTPEALKDLSAGESQTLQTAMKEGLGVLLLFSQPVKELQKIFPYELIPVNTDTVSLASLQWKDKLTLPATPLRVNALPSIQALFKDKENKILSGYFYNGSGKTGFQFLNETYRLMLEGKVNEYARLWSPLIESTSRRKQENFKINITTPFPWFAEEPIHFEIISSSEAPELAYDSIRIPLKEDVGISQLWHGTVWVDHSGWHQLSLQDSTRFNFYVSAEKDWVTLNKTNLLLRNRTYRAEGRSGSSLITGYRPVSPLLFFLLFIFASGVLWLLAKL